MHLTIGHYDFSPCCRHGLVKVFECFLCWSRVSGGERAVVDHVALVHALDLEEYYNEHVHVT